MRRWLITGVSSGIGAALARHALERGDAVVGTARDAGTIANFADLAPGRARCLALDLSRPADIAGAVAHAFADGPVDVVVNNVGRSIFGAFEETSLEEARELFETNVFGTWALTRAALPRLRSQGGGKLVMLSSGCGLMGLPGLSAYCASKFAIEGFSEALAQEVAGFGVQVMLVEPGAVATRFISHGTSEAAERLPDYAFLSGSGKAVLDAFYQSSAASPEAVAAAIVTAVESGPLPLRLLVGDDLKSSVAAKAAALAVLASPELP